MFINSMSLPSARSGNGLGVAMCHEEILRNDGWSLLSFSIAAIDRLKGGSISLHKVIYELNVLLKKRSLLAGVWCG